ncbi:hypothetical protein ACQ7B5_02165 [Escherichia coli]
MWILIFWLSTPFSGSSNVAKQPTLAVHSQEFGSERVCKDALTAMNKVNVGELTLRGVCVSKDEQGFRR